jgi:hypothetical protein
MSTSARRMASKAAILIVCGLAAFATGAIVVHAATTAQTAKKKRAKPWPNFMINAQVSAPLTPGKSVPIKISLASNRLKPIWILRLSVRLTVDQKHAAAGCSVARDYRVVQIPRAAFPIRLAKAFAATKKRKARLRWRTLRAKRTRGRPTLMMLNLPEVNQNACKGATLTVGFNSRSINKRPRRAGWKASAQ